MLEFQLDPLIEAFQPSFEAALAEVTALIPRLAEEAYTAFIGKVSTGRK